MLVAIALWCIAALLVLAVLATAIARQRAATPIVYGVSFAASLVALAGALQCLLASAEPSTAALPLGIPWLGAHFRVDALAAFFLIVVNLGSAAASLYGIGYGRHETAPHRVLPFYPAFVAGMNFVVVADDAFTFFLSWEFMSLTSWAVVTALDPFHDNTHACST